MHSSWSMSRELAKAVQVQNVHRFALKWVYWQLLWISQQRVIQVQRFASTFSLFLFFYSKPSNGLINVPSSPFAEISGRCQLSSNQLDSYLRAEIQHLKRRKLIPRRANITTNSLELSSSTANFRKANSPTSSIVIF